VDTMGGRARAGVPFDAVRSGDIGQSAGDGAHEPRRPIAEVKVVEKVESLVRHTNADREQQLEDAVRTQRPARVTLILGAACVAVFLWGLMLASRDHVESAFLTGFLGGDPAKFNPILDRTGSV